jgi:hypothetical protein
LLDDVMGLSRWDKLGVALGLSLDPLKESISQAVEKTLAPQLFFTVIATGLISWAVLAANPEPVFTKAAAIVSALLLIYLGVETFLELVDASRELKRASDRATTWKELEHASQRFANRVGPEVARVFVLAVKVVVSYGMAGGAAWLASRLAMLPSFSEAAAAGASRVGILLANVGQVSAVAVVGSTVVISLPATAVAMGALGSGSNPSVKAPHIDVPKHNLSRLAPTWAEQRQVLVDAVRQLDGKVGPVATSPHGAIFEGTIQVKDTSGNLVDLTIRWFKYADGRVTINTAFVPP